MKRFTDILEKAPGYTGSARGWVIEELPIPGTSNKATAYVACFGWDSMQAQSTFRATQHYKDNTHLINNAKDLKHKEEVHFSGTPINPGEQF